MLLCLKSSKKLKNTWIIQKECLSLASPKILSLGKTKKTRFSLVFPSLNRIFATSERKF